MTPFIEGSWSPFVLPLMQGFVGQRSFALSKDQGSTLKALPRDISSKHSTGSAKNSQDESRDDNSFLLTLISRRSIHRPGLRYLRRGIDDAGHTANFVETEQILSNAAWTHKTQSFTQIRGSIPLFFTQSPYSFKPVPVLQQSEDTNSAAYKRHFSRLVKRYGSVQIILLTDKSGPEATIGEKYSAITKSVNDEGGIGGEAIGFRWFDFHSECRYLLCFLYIGSSRK